MDQMSGNDSIFPRDHIVQGNERFVNDDGSVFGYPGDKIKVGGLTKRELFAALIMAQLAGTQWEVSAELAVKNADALLAELSKARGQG
jgi:hypothetical protein